MRVVLLTEASNNKGYGHYTRMSSILTACLKKGINTMMYLWADETAEKSFCNGANIVAEFWLKENWISSNIKSNDIVVVDSYNVELELLQTIRDTCKKMVVIDDNVRLPYEEMIVLNPNYYAEVLTYPDNNNTYFTGKDFTLLRAPFYSNVCSSINAKVNTILVTLGGTDVKNLTFASAKILHSLFPEATINAVVANSNIYMKSIYEIIEKNGEVFCDVDARKMCLLMDCSDLIVSAGGGTTNEIIRRQIPSIVIPVAENQKFNANFLKEKQLAIVLGEQEISNMGNYLLYETRKQIWINLRKIYSKKNGVDMILEMCEENYE